tara:strand:+ start:1897 stop:3615 length:1719 start_codon:yes stop_codon:yes gene_type:complete
MDKDFTKYEDASTNVRQLLDVIGTLESTAVENRNSRKLDINVEAERADGHLDEDEFLVPAHIIDTNIRREQSKYVAYITGSRRSAIFTSITEPTTATGELERDFTDKTRYPGWQVPLFKIIDGMQLHGYSIAEVQFDEDKSGHFAVEAVNYEDFGFPADTRDIQACEMLVHRHYFTALQLRDMVDNDDFNEDIVDILLNENPDGEGVNYVDVESLYEVEKVMFKHEGKVFVAWSCCKKSDDWLRDPRPLYLGRRDGETLQDEVDYPYVIFPYTILEDSAIQNATGRAFADRTVQETITSLMSSFVTAHRRAANFYFAKDNEDPNNTNVQTSVRFQPGALIDANIKQFQLTPPDTSMVSAIQSLMSQNAQEQSQINYAAMNRKDSRKTATEVQAASNEAQQLSSTQVSLFSIALKDVYEWCWRIYQSRVIAGALRPAASIDLFLNHKFNIKPAGDVDVIERQEKSQKMMVAWQVVAQTPLAPVFLQNMMRLMFPDEGESYAKMLQIGDQKDQLLQQLLQVVNSLVVDQQTGQLTPEAQPFEQQLKMLQAQVADILGQSQQNAKQQQGTPAPTG